MGLAHANIHLQIAEQHIRDRAWKKAKPHAVAAAESYSCAGLLLASKAYEGLQDWKRSEYFAAEAARSYPSYYSGTSWYFWCRRNGRGDLDAARAIAEPSIKLASQQTRYDEAYRVFVYRVLEGDKAAALAGLDQQIATCLGGEATWNVPWRLLHVIAFAAELHDEERKQQAVAELKAYVEKNIKPTRPNWANIYDDLSAAFCGQPVDEEFISALDHALSGAAAEYRCNYYYFLGEALNQLGQTKKAEFYWRRAAFGGPFDALNATLAGFRLVERFGPDRGGIPEEFARLEEEPTKVDAPDASQDVNEANESATDDLRDDTDSKVHGDGESTTGKDGDASDSPVEGANPKSPSEGS